MSVKPICASLINLLAQPGHWAAYLDAGQFVGVDQMLGYIQEICSNVVSLATSWRVLDIDTEDDWTHAELLAVALFDLHATY